MLNPIQAWRHFFRETIWQPDPQGRLAPWVFKTLQILILAFRDLIDKGALLRTSALGYASVLAIIPMLALLFAIFKGFGLQRLLAAHLLPQLAGGSQDFARQIISYVETTNVASLGVFGVIWLLVALMILMTNIEQAFNHIWKISRSRPWWRKLSDYLSIFLLFPILMAVAISMTSVLQSHPELLQSFKPFIPDIFFSAYNLLISIGMIWLGFSFIYLVMPNTRVRLISAILGGFIGGTIWQGAQWLFQWFQSSAPYYNAIYGALYQILFLVIWMFWSWLIVLYGGEVAYTHQNLASLRRHYELTGSTGKFLDDDYLALLALLSIGDRYYSGGAPLTLRDLTRLFNDQEDVAAGSIEILQKCGLVMPVAANGLAGMSGFLPSRPLEQIQVKDLLACLRHDRRLRLGRLLPATNHFSHIVGQLVEQPDCPLYDLSVLELLVKAQPAPQAAVHITKYRPTQV
jgi:membrane protein